MQFIAALSCVPLEALLCSPAPSSFFCGPCGSKAVTLLRGKSWYPRTTGTPPCLPKIHWSSSHTLINSGDSNRSGETPHSATSHVRMALTFLRRAVSGSKEKTAPKEAWVYAQSLHTDISSPVHGIDYGGWHQVCSQKHQKWVSPEPSHDPTTVAS